VDPVSARLLVIRHSQFFRSPVALLEVGISAFFVLEVFLFVLEIEFLFGDGCDLEFRNLGWQGLSEFEI
jgi:hypothetical protein